jgi:DNA-binding beta-propeller fold protein YncE
MAEQSVNSSSPRSFGAGRIFTLLLGVVCFGVLVYFIVQVMIQFVTPSSIHRLQLVTDISLPSVEVPANGQPQLQAIRFDHFDFQVLDPTNGLLFIAHPGPSGVKLDLLLQLKQLPPGTQFKGSIAVVDIRHNRFVTNIDLPNIHGLVLDPEDHRIYAAGSTADVVYSIDEQTLKPTPINVAPKCNPAKAPCENPDSLTYDPVDHKIFVSSPGGQNQVVIDTRTNTLLPKPIDLSGDKTGDDIGHTRYDPVSQRVFVVVQPFQPNPKDPHSPWPAAKLVAINPTTDSIVTSVTLPGECTSAHGLSLDSQQQVAFVACIDSQKLVMVDIRSIKVIGGIQAVGFKPDIVAVDNNLHVLFVGCASGVSVFNESGASNGALQKLSDYTISSSSAHSLAVDENTHTIYIPLTDVGGRPVLRIEQYNPKGNV